jgi:hypothetical protein
MTDRRVLILSGLFSRRITSIALQNLGDVALSERSDRSGTITFVRHGGSMDPAWWQGAWPGHGQAPAFDLVDDVRRPYDVIQEAQHAATGRGRA